MHLVRASIDVRASVADALRRWGERRGAAPSLPSGAASGMVAFQPLGAAQSRVTVQLEVGRVAREPGTGFVEVVRGELERELRAFKHVLEGSARAPQRQESG